MKQLDISKLKELQADGKFSRIGSVAVLNNQINQIYKTLGDSIKDYRVFYRGHADYVFAAEPSIYRTNPRTGKRYIDSEYDFCTELMRECPAEFDFRMSTFDMLVKMQHYELPTRLLDITENPLVALYFASLEPQTKGHDGQILVYFVHKDDLANFNTLEVGVISSISFLHYSVLKGASTPARFNELLSNMRQFANQLPYLRNINDLNKTLCVLPKKSNPRITRQQGAFFLFGIQNGDKQQMSSLDIEPFKLIVSNDSRASIQSQLERFSISEKALFPEIDKVAHYIKTH